jgi:ribosome biogenesis GTPase
VGKSTLIGALTGATLATSDIREDDAKGRHTTTARSVHRIAGGGLLIDMPGMRELALFDAASGIGELFEDIVTLSQECRFRDCAHGGEPGCAIRAAIAAGDLDEGRFERWQKLRDEDAYLTRTVHEARQQGRAFGRMVKQAKRDKTRR